MTSGELIWGGRITTRQSEPLQLARMLKSDIVKIFPQLEKLDVDRAWSGLMGYARHKMPLIGELWPNSNQGVWACTGFGGHGLNTTAMGGVLVANALANKSEDWRLFDAFAPQWTGGTLGRIGVQLCYWNMQFRDRQDERKFLN